MLIRRILTRLWKTGPWETLAYFSGAVLSKFGIEILQAYSLPEAILAELPSPAPLTFSIAHSESGLSESDRHSLLEYDSQMIEEFRSLFGRGARCAILRDPGDGIVCACWLMSRSHYAVPASRLCTVIERCFVMPEYRGRGFYPMTLRLAYQTLIMSGISPQQIIIESSVFNASSVRGILTAGFTPVGRSWRIPGRTHSKKYVGCREVRL